MNKTRMRAALILAMVTGITLSGCSMLLPQAEKPASDSAPPSTSSAPVDNSDDAESPAGSFTVSGDIAAPGSTVKLGDWASYEYVGFDDTKAVIAARLVGIDKASQTQTDFLVSEIPQLKGYTVWLLTVEQQKVSGGEIAHQSDNVSFYPATKDKLKAQAVSVIGWDECKTNAFSRDFDTAGATITQCLIGATVQGGDDIAGVIYGKFDSAYDYYDGKPLAFLK